MSIIRTVAIIGGGFSGTLQAINLLRHDGPRAILIERRPEIGRGVAYSAAHPSHLLNVRAGNMSALPDEPQHFVQWLERRGSGGAGDFVPRIVYGEYLAELLETARARAPARLEIIEGDAVAIRADQRATIRLADGRTVDADAAVLALGNLPPAPPENLDPQRLSPASYAADPWAGDLAEGLSADDSLLAVGTGLTMIDVALLLDARGFRGRIMALSRRGLLPRVHAAGAPVGTKLEERPPLEVSTLLQSVRERADAIGWRAAVDELRPFTQNVWLAASTEQRARFLRHLRPWWDVHRHRIAPDIAERIDAFQREGRLTVAAGRTLGFEQAGDRVKVTWRPRGSDRCEEMLVRRVVNCTGPQIDLSRTREPLLQDLASQGLISADPLNLGIAVDNQARVIGGSGQAHERIFALGPMTKGTFWEITAVPDIRVQTWTLARLLSNAHWVGGEGL